MLADLGTYLRQTHPHARDGGTVRLLNCALLSVIADPDGAQVVLRAVIEGKPLMGTLIVEGGDPAALARLLATWPRSAPFGDPVGHVEGKLRPERGWRTPDGQSVCPLYGRLARELDA